MTDELGKYMSTRDAAAEIGVEYTTLMARIRKGKIPAVKKGWSTLVHIDDVKKAKLQEKKNAAAKSLEKTTR